jgi:hypothetical protein
MASTARFGAPSLGDERLTLRYDIRAVGIVSLTDRITGQFRPGTGNFQRALEQVHRRAAEEAQKRMAEVLDRKIAKNRVQRPGERLKMATLHKDNYEATATGFAVGRPSWLDRSPAALYWRRIEEGDAVTFDSEILFTNNHPGGPYHLPARGPVWGGGAGGMKHMRMPQHKGPLVHNIGPYPEYAFMREGARVMRRNFNFRKAYETTLAAYGINIADVAGPGF